MTSMLADIAKDKPTGWPRAGALLMPLGRFNLSHDENRWDLPRRTLVNRVAPVLPVKATWTELGIGVAGRLLYSPTLGHDLAVSGYVGE